MEKEECGMLLNKLEKKVPGNGLSLTIMYQIWNRLSVLITLKGFILSSRKNKKRQIRVATIPI